jgi:hypothetical protein
VVFLEGIRCPIDEKNTDECYIRPPSLPIDVAALRDLIRREHAALAVVDVLNAYLSNRVDGHKDQDIRTALAPLAKLAEETGCCIVVVRHLNKSGGGNPLYRGGGSIGIIGAARVGLLAATDPDDSERSVLAVTKCNVAELAPALAYRLLCDEENGCARVQWEGVTRHQAEDLLSTRADEDNDTLDAKDVLHLILADHAGAMPMNEAVAAMAEAGFSKDQARRAKERLGARSLKVGKPGDPEQAWYWVLPGCEGGTKKSQGGEDGGSPEPAPFASFVPPSAGATTAARSLDSVEEDF